jgi:hypothetical protein
MQESCDDAHTFSANKGNANAALKRKQLNAGKSLRRSYTQRKQGQCKHSSEAKAAAPGRTLPQIGTGPKDSNLGGRLAMCCWLLRVQN